MSQDILALLSKFAANPDLLPQFQAFLEAQGAAKSSVPESGPPAGPSIPNAEETRGQPTTRNQCLTPCQKSPPRRSIKDHKNTQNPYPSPSVDTSIWHSYHSDSRSLTHNHARSPARSPAHYPARSPIVIVLGLRLLIVPGLAVVIVVAPAPLPLPFSLSLLDPFLLSLSDPFLLLLSDPFSLLLSNQPTTETEKPRGWGKADYYNQMPTSYQKGGGSEGGRRGGRVYEFVKGAKVIKATFLERMSARRHTNL
ncbi:hypothetical protein RHS01_04151 [Rhizoctonia solani]|uniref:Uncharacterized protein n=1 Tax=Rhizoctonia solani TaxID=456999 RepID=A0A8H7IEC8_9AGAM|nr:hypothetical protein RHS01_04151 [Rhizoctonia solani]